MLGFILDSRKHYWGSIQRRHCIQPRQLFLFVYNIRAAHKSVPSQFHWIGLLAFKLTVAALSGKINFTSALFPIWKFCWIDRGWRADKGQLAKWIYRWTRHQNEMKETPLSVPTRWKTPLSVGKTSLLVPSERVEHSHAPMLRHRFFFAFTAFSPQKFPRTKMKIVRLIKR